LVHIVDGSSNRISSQRSEPRGAFVGRRIGRTFGRRLDRRDDGLAERLELLDLERCLSPHRIHALASALNSRVRLQHVDAKIERIAQKFKEVCPEVRGRRVTVEVDHSRAPEASYRPWTVSRTGKRSTTLSPSLPRRPSCHAENTRHLLGRPE